MTPACKVSAKYMRTSPRLRRFFAGVFLIEIEVEEGGFVEDLMFPDWATLRFNHEPLIAGRMRSGWQFGNSRFAGAGPRSQEVYLRTGSVRQWGVLIHPVGWALLVAEPANEFANKLFDGMTTPAFAKFRPLAETLFNGEVDPEGELQRLTSFFETLDPIENPAVGKIADIYRAIYDEEIGTVEQLAERAGVSRRTLERLCQRSFGFAPKMVLRRQRFVRSLAHFTVDPSLKWIGAMDASYHDQAQFVRDFHEFMGMTPTEYRQLPKPIMEPVMRERVRYATAFTREVLEGKTWRDLGRDLGRDMGREQGLHL